jgi:excisionase family DNA binding protein
MKTILKARELYSIEDARYLLGGISRMTIYQLLNEGELASVLIGRRRFISAAAITAFIATSSTNVAPSEQRRPDSSRAVQIASQVRMPAAKQGRQREAARR